MLIIVNIKSTDTIGINIKDNTPKTDDLSGSVDIFSAKWFQKVGLISLTKSYTTKEANMLKRTLRKIAIDKRGLGGVGSIFFQVVLPTTSEPSENLASEFRF